MPQIAHTRFINMLPSPFVQKRIEAEAAALARMHPTVGACDVTVTAPSAHHHTGSPFAVHIIVRMPGPDIVISHEGQENQAHKDVYVAIRNAFDAARNALAARKPDHARSA